MTDIEICDFLKDWLTLQVPTAINTTISNIAGNTVQLATTIGAANVWSGAVFEVTNSTVANRKRGVILTSTSNTVTLATPFNTTRRPQVGDSVKLWGGPLADAQIYTFEPDSIEAALKRGKKYFVVVSVSGGSIAQTGLGGALTRGADNQHSEYTVEVTGETLDITGTTTTDDVYRVAVELPTLKEQLIRMCHWFRMQTSNSAYGVGKIPFKYLSYQRTGSPIRLRGAVLQFNMTVR